MEHKFIASVRVLLPSRQLIVECQRHALFELAVVIGRKTDCHTRHLKTQTDIEVLRDVSIGPPFCLSVRGIDKCNTLDGFPAKDCIVANKGGNVTAANTVPDSSIDDIGEIGDCIVSGTYCVVCDKDLHLLPFSKRLWATCITPEPC